MSRATKLQGRVGLDLVYGMLEDEFGIDFTHYKPSTVTRRIERRLKLSRTEDIEQYISCRNLLIYLQPAAQQKALGLFHFALNRGGILLLGPSETAGMLTSEFQTLDAHWRIYCRHGDVRLATLGALAPGRSVASSHGPALQARPRPRPPY